VSEAIRATEVTERIVRSVSARKTATTGFSSSLLEWSFEANDIGVEIKAYKGQVFLTWGELDALLEQIESARGMLRESRELPGLSV
jgi:hypothetical protein